MCPKLHSCTHFTILVWVISTVQGQTTDCKCSLGAPKLGGFLDKIKPKTLFQADNKHTSVPSGGIQI